MSVGGRVKKWLGREKQRGCGGLTTARKNIVRLTRPVVSYGAKVSEVAGCKKFPPFKTLTPHSGENGERGYISARPG